MEVDIVVGGQYGSEAKGHVAGILAAAKADPEAASIRVGGSNAGHTVYDRQGRRYAFRHMPVAAVLNEGPLIIGPGSELDLDVLLTEVDACEADGHSIDGRLFVSEQATLVTQWHRDSEQQMRGRIGSTAKGVGAARSDRIWRAARIVGDIPVDERPPWLRVVHDDGLRALCTGVPVIIEGTQGYGLGLHAGHYPFCTSGDCRAIDFLAQSGLGGRGHEFRTWVVFRTFPIRVAGNSGPLENEISWEELSTRTDGYIQPEQTTVTKLTRRVAEWDPDLAAEAMRQNSHLGMPLPVLMFVDYLDPTLAGAITMHRLMRSPAWPIIEQMEQDINARFVLFGTGPDSHIWR